MATHGGTVAKRLLILSDRIGGGDPQLGRVLMKNFLYTVARSAQAPKAIVFMNEGVRLACEGSESLDDLRLCQVNGVAVKACGTCLDYLGLKGSLAVGEVGAMTDSVAALLGSDDVVTIG